MARSTQANSRAPSAADSPTGVHGLSRMVVQRHVEAIVMNAHKEKKWSDRTANTTSFRWAQLKPRDGTADHEGQDRRPEVPKQENTGFAFASAFMPRH